MTTAPDLARMVPGFEFLQSLMKGAGAAVPGMLPGMSQWVAPTLDPDEIQKRIDELKTVQFWLEQNARLLATTIQALDVQRMTLATLQSMNLPMADLQDALRIKPAPAAVKPRAEAPAMPPTPAAAPATSATAATAQPQPKPQSAGAASASAAPAVDPLQWWSALTQQFTDIVKDNAAAMAAGTAGLPGAPTPVAGTAATATSRSTAPGAHTTPATQRPSRKSAAAAGRKKPGRASGGT